MANSACLLVHVMHAEVFCVRYFRNEKNKKRYNIGSGIKKRMPTRCFFERVNYLRSQMLSTDAYSQKQLFRKSEIGGNGNNFVSETSSIQIVSQQRTFRRKDTTFVFRYPRIRFIDMHSPIRPSK